MLAGHRDDLALTCAGSNVMHPVGSFVVGGVAGALFVVMFQVCHNRWKIDDVLGVWPLHGLCGLWGGIACGIFGTEALGGLGGVTFMSQLVGFFFFQLLAPLTSYFCIVHPHL